MKTGKMGISLIILGNLLYIANLLFGRNDVASSFGDFSSGLLIGLSIGSNLVGIVLTVANMAKNNLENKK